MELVIFVFALAGFGILAYHAGYDSRPNVSSREHDLARYGMTWPRPAPDEELATGLRMSRMRRQAAAEHRLPAPTGVPWRSLPCKPESICAVDDRLAS